MIGKMVEVVQDSHVERTFKLSETRIDTPRCTGSLNEVASGTFDDEVRGQELKRVRPHEGTGVHRYLQRGVGSTHAERRVPMGWPCWHRRQLRARARYR